jgi:hypothetical protein
MNAREAYLEVVLCHPRQVTKPRRCPLARLLPAIVPRLPGRIPTRPQPTARSGRPWWGSRASRASCSRSQAGLWFWSINFGYMQNAPQTRRHGATAYCRCHLIPLFHCRPRGLFAAELGYAVVDGLGLCRRRGCGGARALQRGVDIIGFRGRICWAMFLGHGSVGRRCTTFAPPGVMWCAMWVTAGSCQV